MKMSGSNSNNPGIGGNSNHGNMVNNQQEDGFIEIWQHNLEEEFVKIRKIVQKYPYISMVHALVNIIVSLSS